MAVHYTDAPGEHRWLIRRRGLPAYVGDLKVCRRCEHAKPPSDFPQAAQRTDGLSPYCKSCVATARAERKRRAPEHVRALGRTHSASYRARRRPRRRYVPAGERPFITDATIAKQQGRMRLHYALRKGTIVRPDRCSACGKVAPVEGHHAHGYDGDAALDVDWYCRPCHQLAHGWTPRQEVTNAAVA